MYDPEECVEVRGIIIFFMPDNASEVLQIFLQAMDLR
jgi:hypothetical protein